MRTGENLVEELGDDGASSRPTASINSAVFSLMPLNHPPPRPCPSGSHPGFLSPDAQLQTSHFPSSTGQQLVKENIGNNMNAHGDGDKSQPQPPKCWEPVHFKMGRFSIQMNLSFVTFLLIDRVKSILGDMRPPGVAGGGRMRC